MRRKLLCGELRRRGRAHAELRAVRHAAVPTRRDVGALEHDARAADLNLVAGVNLALVDARPVDDRARLVAEIDQRDVVGRSDLDDRVHARRELVVDPQVTLRVFADLDDVLRHGLTTNELIAFVETERERQPSPCPGLASLCLVFLYVAIF